MDEQQPPSLIVISEIRGTPAHLYAHFLLNPTFSEQGVCRLGIPDSNEA